MRNIKRYFTLLFFIGIPLIVMIVWFYKGLIYGGGESGIFFNNITISLNALFHAWNSLYIGGHTFWLVVDIPYMLLFSFFEKIGIPPFINQAIFFFFIFVTSGIGMFLLIKDIFKKDTIAFVSVLFYWFNVLSMTLIWNRFQFPFMALYALLPIILFVYRRGLQKKEYIYCIYVNILLLIFNILFFSVPTLMLFFGVLFFYALFYIFYQKLSLKTFLFVIIFNILMLALWIVLNTWWLLQMFEGLFQVSYIANVTYTPSGDLNTLQSISQQLGNMAYVLRLLHKVFFIDTQKIWLNFYLSPIFIIISFITPLLVFGSMLIKKKVKEYYFFLFLAMLGIFLAKGIADPFGGIFYILFTHVRMLEAFRNPFEKVGLILPLAYAPLFSYGLYSLTQKIKNIRIAKSVFYGVIFLTCFVSVWPMFNGWVFMSTEPPTNNPNVGDRVKVPAYYSEANTWLNQKDPTQSRVIALPQGYEGITYTWNYGYNGVELSSQLFDRPFLSLCVQVAYFCPITANLQPLLLSYPEDFWKVLPALNTSFVMVRDDIMYKLRGMLDPQEVTRIMQKNSAYISPSKIFGHLSFYELQPSLRQQKIYTTSSGVYIQTVVNDSFVSSAPFLSPQKDGVYFTDTRSTMLPIELSHAQKLILQADVLKKTNIKVSAENSLAELPYVRFMPGSLFYIYSRLREKINDFFAGNNQFPLQLDESGKRLAEIFGLLQNRKYGLAEKTRAEYEKDLINLTQNQVNFSDDASRSVILREQFVLEQIIANGSIQGYPVAGYQNDLNIVDTLLLSLHLNTKYPVDYSKEVAYGVVVPQDGEYSLNLDTRNWTIYYSSTNLPLEVDGKNIGSISIDPTKNIQEITSLQLSKGYHQISIGLGNIKNIASQAEATVSAGVKPVNYSIPFTQFDKLGSYTISFDYYVQKGGLPSSYIQEDTDITMDGILYPSQRFIFQSDKYNHDWINFEGDYAAHQVAHTSALHIVVSPWNNCEETYPWLFGIKCKDITFKALFNRPSIIQLKNISITRDVTNNLWLVKKMDVQPQASPSIHIIENNPSDYTVQVSHAISPYFLTFLEAFHPFWQLKIVGENTIIPDHMLMDNYANGWYINKKGDYTLEMNFSAEKVLQIGEVISSIGFILVAGIVILWKRVKR